MKETFYFSHDYNARNDEKILKLLSGKDGWYSYGLYWGIIEKLYEAGGYLKLDYDCIAFDMRTDSERIRTVIDSELFERSNEKFYSKSVLARLRARKGKSEKARQSASMRWNKAKKEDANAMRTQCDSNAIKERKGKDSKVKEKNTKRVFSSSLKRSALKIKTPRNFLNERRAEKGKPPMKTPRTTKQEKVVQALKLIDHFKNTFYEVHGECPYLTGNPQENPKMAKLAQSAIETLGDKSEEYITWWINEGGEWSDYSPQACFTIGQMQKWQAKKITKKKGGSIAHLFQSV